MGYNQMLHNLTSQAAIMNTHGIPNDFISNVNPFALIILIPIFDQLVYPLLRKRNINFSPLKRITAGFFAALLAMVWSAVTQAYIYRMSPCKKYANECEGKTAPMSVWIQTGPLGELSPFLSPPQEPAAADGGLPGPKKSITRPERTPSRDNRDGILLHQSPDQHALPRVCHIPVHDGHRQRRGTGFPSALRRPAVGVELLRDEHAPAVRHRRLLVHFQGPG